MENIHTYNFEGKRALIRVDFNVPLDKETGKISDDTRIRAAAPTILHVLKNGGSVVLLSHFGRPKNGPEAAFSLQQIVAHTAEVLGTNVHFVDDCIGEKALTASQNLKAGEVLLLENVRFIRKKQMETSTLRKL
jgi:phosphoglycerate kinase